jgi:hypothetical protein
LNSDDVSRKFAYECHIRDCYAAQLAALRPNELLSQREVSHQKSKVRADLRTVNKQDVIFEWEFKIRADYSSIGQILVYVAQAKTDFGFERTVRPVIAAFDFPEEIKLAVHVNNLGIEMVVLPLWMRNAGFVPSLTSSPPKIIIPRQMALPNQGE